MLTSGQIVFNYCPVCNDKTPSVCYPVEKLPPNNQWILWKTSHVLDNEKRIIHSWITMNTDKEELLELSTLFGIDKKPTVMKCPSCHKFGRVNWYRPDKTRIDKVVYILVHEPIGGKWGKVTKVLKRRRCYITDILQRELVLRKVGRYIGPKIK